MTTSTYKLCVQGMCLAALVAVSGAVVCSVPPEQQPPAGVVFRGECVRVIDGDTIDVSTNVILRIRLLDCWAPESRTKDLDEKRRGLAAKQRLKELIDGKPIRVSIPTGETLGDSLTLGRVLGHVWIGDNDHTVNQQMVDEGHATATKQGTAP